MTDQEREKQYLWFQTEVAKGSMATRTCYDIFDNEGEAKISDSNKEEFVKIDNDITRLRNKVNKTHHIKFEKSRQAYHENVQPGSIRKWQGDLMFIHEMSALNDPNEFFDNFEMTEDGGGWSMFKVNEQLTIHPRAFFQMPGDVRTAILKGTRKMNQNPKMARNEKINVFRHSFESINSDNYYRIWLDAEVDDREERLLDVTKFNSPSLADIRIGDRSIFDKLKPSEINRLFRVAENWTNRFIELAKVFAARLGVENLSDFCAAGEYIHDVVNTAFKAQRKDIEDPGGRSKKQLEESLKEKIIEDHLQNHKLTDIATTLQNLMKRCNQAYDPDGPRFGSLMTAANHVNKHAREFTKDLSMLPETYLGLAQSLTHSLHSQVKWTQDGEGLCCTYICEEQ